MNLIPVNRSRESQIQQLERINDKYQYNARLWFQWLRDNDKEINAESVREFFDYLNTCKHEAYREIDGKRVRELVVYSPHTIAIKRAAVKKRVRQLFKSMPVDFQLKLEKELKNIDEEIPAPQMNGCSVPSEKIITKKEYRDLLDKCRSNRQKCFIQFLFSTGCRVNELTGIKLTDCRNEGGFYYIRVQGKGSKKVEYKQRFVRIDADLYSYISQTFQGKEYLFETENGKRYQNDYISKQIKKIGALIGRKISAHTMRHSFITIAIEKNPSKIDAVSKYAGHHSVSITLDMYTHTQLSNDELLNIYS